ncbi:MAG: alpha/beta hydrolase [Eubacterium sp.]|nr:alpha/beta hydrolase [Eubacterium sp.]
MEKRKRKTKPRLRLVIIICCILLVLSFGMMLGLADYVMRVKRQSLEDAIAWQSDHYDTSFYDKLEKKDYLVSAEDGYKLHAQLLVNPNPTDRYVILSHGHTDNHIGSLKYVPMYLRLGFNCIIYDLRAHGENEQTFVTYGVREGADLYSLIRDTRERYPELKTLGLHGESLGAATTISSLKYGAQNPAGFVDFAVADCGFADIENVLRGVLKKSRIPSFLVDLADLGARLRYGYAIMKMRPIDSLAENTVPILFVHGAEDDFIPPENSKRMAAATKGMSRILLVPGATHAMSILTDPETYEKTLDAFLKDILK